MKKSSLMEVIKGVAAAVLVFSLIVSIAPINVAHSQNEPLFSVTLIAPGTGNPVRRQHAQIIANSMQQVGIDAKLFYVNFDEIVTRLFFLSSKPGSTFEEGGYDIGFIGWGFTAPIPDFGTQFTNTPESFAPVGNNYYMYNNSEITELFREYSHTTNLTKQYELAHKIQRILKHDLPNIIIYETLDIIARNPKVTDYGSKDVYSTYAFPDIQHLGGVTEFTLAESGNVFPNGNLNPLPTTSSNSFYALYIYAPLFSSLMEIDPRTGAFYKALAKNIVVSDDGLTWTVSFRPHTWHDSAKVTADDFLFTIWAGLNPKAASVGLGSNIEYLGNAVSFTWLNGTTTWMNNTAPGEPVRIGHWVALNETAFQFTLPEVYAFTYQTYCAFYPLPKHILEQYPPDQWDKIPYSTASEPYTYHWDTSIYGGNGTYTAYGPVGNGPYVFKGYDFVNNVATEVKFKDYWNRTGLESIGEFTVEVYKVKWIGTKDAAIAALKNGEVDMLETNYQLATDVDTLKSLGFNVIYSPTAGWQEMGINMMHPILGTGVDTPLGKSDPSKAAEAARHVRQAISYLVPRELIIKNLLNGAGKPGTTSFVSAFGPYHDPTIAPDPYSPELAKKELQAAGYGVSALPPSIGGLQTIPSIQVPSGFPVKFPEHLVGLPLTFSGRFVVDPVISISQNGFVVVLQQSTDNKTWTNVAVSYTDTAGYYNIMYIPTEPGTYYYRVWLTGVGVNVVRGATVGGPNADYEHLRLPGKSVAPEYSPVSKITVGSWADVFSQLATKSDIATLTNNVNSRFDTISKNFDTVSKNFDTLNSQISGLSNSVSSMSDEISSLKSQLATVSSVAYVAIIIAIILGLIAIFLARKR